MEKINIKKQGEHLEIEISRSTTARTILDGMLLYVDTISKMTGITVQQVVDDLKSAVLKRDGDKNGLQDKK